MPNVDEIYPSKFMRAVDLNGRDTTATIAYVTIEPFEADGKKQNKPVLHFEEGHLKPPVANKTNLNEIAKFAGENTGSWPGTKVTLFSCKVAFGSKITDGVRVRQPLAAAMNDEIPL